MIKQQHVLMFLLIVLVLLVGVQGFNKFEDVRETHDGIVTLQANGQFWLSNDTAYFIREGALLPCELKALLELSYEKEVVIFSDLRDE